MTDGARENPDLVMDWLDESVASLDLSVGCILPDMSSDRRTEIERRRTVDG
jgi:hypothetical protein